MNKYIDNLNQTSFADLKTKLERWERLVTEGASVDILVEEVNDITTNCPFQCLKRNTGHFYRARKNEGRNFFNNIEDVWYPREEFVKEVGRANRSGESKMYISQLPRTTLFEMQLKKGDNVTISKIGIKADSELNVQFISSAEKNSKVVKDEILFNMGLNENGVKNYHTIHKFLSDEFTKPDKKWYPLSTAITETITSYEESDGLLYPSMQSKNDLNIVLKKESADGKLELISSVCFEVIAENLNGSLTIKDIAATSLIDKETGELLWNDSLRVDKVWNESERFGMSKINVGS
ncbi:hypothetical protein MC378_00820 [Polaribacter sp. MSW13]|uniref:RES domain-containing protein n=1 Tax=Polaribacter marinus TaxID=2916838 RepID=A0A9X1VKA2_9FLAO|nr:hypothetical protein [Polaribacter marinus]MCI2227687.1 hypothetical protein [Polaribacter marinus]